MVEAKFTKGPWEANYSPHKIGVFAPEVARCIAEVYLPPADYSTDEANAHLIAAAPDLYRALEEARNQIIAFALDSLPRDVAVEQVKYIDTALARARGEAGE